MNPVPLGLINVVSVAQPLPGRVTPAPRDARSEIHVLSSNANPLGLVRAGMGWIFCSVGVSYSATVQRAAVKVLASIESRQRERLKEVITALGHNPRSRGCRKLRVATGGRVRIGVDGWWVRVDDYRIVYVINEGVHVVDVRHVGYRREIYREV